MQFSKNHNFYFLINTKGHSLFIFSKSSSSSKMHTFLVRNSAVFHLLVYKFANIIMAKC